MCHIKPAQKSSLTTDSAEEAVVKGAILKDYGYGKDPYIKRIAKLLTANVVYHEIRDQKLLKTVWNNTSGDFNAIVFVNAKSLIPSLPQIFPELAEDELESLSSQLQSMVTKLTSE